MGIGDIEPGLAGQREAHPAADRFEPPVLLGSAAVEVPQADTVVEAIDLRQHFLAGWQVGAQFGAGRIGAIAGVRARIVAATDSQVADRELVVVEQRVVGPLAAHLACQLEDRDDLDDRAEPDLGIELPPHHECPALPSNREGA